MLNLKKMNILLGILLTAIICSSCSAKKASIIDEQLISEEDNFGVCVAEIGQYTETKNYSGSVYYPLSKSVRSIYEGVLLEKICVEAGDYVNEGDLLVSIQPVTEEVIAEQEAKIAKNLEDLNKTIANFQAEIQSLNTEIANSSGTQKQIYELEKKKTELRLQYYKETGEQDQNNMREELEYMKNLQGDLNIYASFEGVIDKVESIPEGTELTRERELLTMHSEKENLIIVSDASDLKYNMEVTVEAGVGDNRKSYKGIVVRADNVLDDAYQTREAYIRLEEEVAAEQLKNVSVTADINTLKNVLIVKDYTISTQKGKDYVYISDGERIMKRRVIVGGRNGSEAWIIKGLEEGQEVLIQ